MIVDGEYQLITKDIAGARTKNRFAYEIDYGISKIYDWGCRHFFRLIL